MDQCGSVMRGSDIWLAPINLQITIPPDWLPIRSLLMIFSGPVIQDSSLSSGVFYNFVISNYKLSFIWRWLLAWHFTLGTSWSTFSFPFTALGWYLVLLSVESLQSPLSTYLGDSTSALCLMQWVSSSESQSIVSGQHVLEGRVTHKN